MARNPLTRVWSAEDTSTITVPARQLLLADGGKNPSAAEARLATQFLTANQPTLLSYGVGCSLGSSSNGTVQLRFTTSSTIGALPLKSPTTGGCDFGMLIKPRFGWAGIGELLSQTGPAVRPVIPKLPLLPRSEVGVPPWVISAIVLSRLLRYLAVSRRRFLSKTAVEDRPRGSINWTNYIAQHVSKGSPNEVPCTYSALQEDPELIGAIHAAALKQRSSLSSITSGALVCRRLVAEYQLLIEHVNWAPPRWTYRSSVSTGADAAELREALEAVRWTHDETGLAGLSPVGGLPWRLQMEEVFEVWVEGIAKHLARTHGGIVRTGRSRETLRPLQWSPPYTGSQRYLLPDVELVRDGETIIFEAKYKAHWEEIEEKRWYGIDEFVRETHRSDLLQVLAYAGATDAARITCVLLYPCKPETWRSLQDRSRSFHVAEIPAGQRAVRLILAAVPLGESQAAISQEMWRALAAP